MAAVYTDSNFDTEVMKADIHDYINTLSYAIDATRSKGLFGSSWDWGSVDVYMTQKKLKP